MRLRTRAMMPGWKKVILGIVALIAAAGLFDGLSNMPIVSGCAFYGECPRDLPSDPLSER